jgi:hypothetical protein
MTKVSSNAGKHPYLREDKQLELFGDVKRTIQNPIKNNFNVKFNIIADTEYYDKNNNLIFFNDKILFEGEIYKVHYHSILHFWTIKNEHNEFPLSHVYNECIKQF